MPTRDEICQFVRQLFDEWIQTPDDIWVALYRLLLDYAHGVPRITDANRLERGIWRRRAQHVEQSLATVLGCEIGEVVDRVDVLMRRLYVVDAQKMNPLGIAVACAIIYLIERFAAGSYRFQMEAQIGRDVFPKLTGFFRKGVDIVAFQGSEPYAAISSKWGIRHDRVRDPQEEANTYKQQVPTLKFFVVTNEFDSARLQKVLTWPTIDGVFHVRRDLVWQLYGSVAAPGQRALLGEEVPVAPRALARLRDLTELFAFFP